MLGKVGGRLLVLAGAGVALAGCGGAGVPVSASATSTTAGATLNSAATARPIYVEMDPTPPAQRPAEFDIYNHTELTGLSWSSWGGMTARGSGVLDDVDCTPDCASGHDDKFPATIVLSDVREVNGQLEYTRFTVTFQGQDKHPDLAKALNDQPTNPRH
ncbi:MAG TPA: hypothetical protein VJ914_35595 [Pseudonocardiaceae bacterium]|nr:hypothetical protein [Pseudonocardiaceae bacterium]